LYVHSFIGKKKMKSGCIQFMNVAVENTTWKQRTPSSQNQAVIVAPCAFALTNGAAALGQLWGSRKDFCECGEQAGFDEGKWGSEPRMDTG
jgi:hypothetical protein